MCDYLKINRKRYFSDYLYQVEMLSFQQGSDKVVFDSLRWQRLQLCIDSITMYLLNECCFVGVKF